MSQIQTDHGSIPNLAAQQMINSHVMFERKKGLLYQSNIPISQQIKTLSIVELAKMITTTTPNHLRHPCPDPPCENSHDPRNYRQFES